MKVIAVSNQKGGVGKTTITRELSACIALRGYQVLAIDCDSQGSLTNSWLDLEPNWPTLSNVLIEPEGAGQRAKPLPIRDAILQSPVENLDLVGSNIRLQRFELQQDYMTPRLRHQLHEHCQDYDFVLLDCPPQLGKLLIAAFNAADYLLIPCEADVVGLVGLPDLDYTIEQVRSNMNPNLERLGAVMNKYLPNRNISFNARNAIGEASELVGPLFDTNIHQYAKITEAPGARMAVVEFAPNHRAAEQLWSFTDEVFDRLHISRQKISAVK